ncbi:hypothetical protein J7L36_00230 [bacterium]|nr:hypothetical protein [bacterium]
MFFREDKIGKEIQKLKTLLKEIRELKRTQEEEGGGDLLEMLRRSLQRTEKNRLLLEIFKESRDIRLEEAESERELRELLREIGGQQQQRQQQQQQQQQTRQRRTRISAQQFQTLSQAVAFAMNSTQNLRTAIAALEGNSTAVVQIMTAGSNIPGYSEFITVLQNEALKALLVKMLKAITT